METSDTVPTSSKQQQAVQQSAPASSSMNIILVAVLILIIAIGCSVLSVGVFWAINREKLEEKPDEKKPPVETTKDTPIPGDKKPDKPEVSPPQEKPDSPPAAKPVEMQLGRITDISSSTDGFSVKFTTLEWGEGDEYVDGNWFDESNSKKLTLKPHDDLKIFRFPDFKTDCSIYEFASSGDIVDPYSVKLDATIEELDNVLDCYGGSMIAEATYQDGNVLMISQVFIP